MLKDSIAKALRIGTASAKALDSEFERHIRTARAEMIRSGVSDVLANSSHDLIEDAIITFCLMKMGPKEQYEQNKESWEYQVDCIRKSKKLLDQMTEEEGANDEE
ncbi:MAG: hypothetical protein J6J38_07805 [Lachnospiraceae bacterium]|nr:hypothetical protein [Lachnospiraceae bacterium]